MPKCNFCGKAYEFPRGLTLVLKNGEVIHFCSSKCRKYWKMGRKKGKWAISNVSLVEEKEERAEKSEEEKEEKEKEKK